MHKAVEANLKQLVGFTVESIGETEGDEVTEAVPYLVFVKGKKTIVAFIYCDEEGNGPGHLMLDGDVDPSISF